MKLHLPSGLRSALFACFAAVTALGTTIATATITGGVFAVVIAGSVASAAEYTASLSGAMFKCTSADGTTMDVHSLTAEDTLVLGGISGWVDVNNTTWNAKLQLNPGSDDSGNATPAWIISDGSNRTYWFHGAVSGAGDMVIASKAGSPHTIVFTGDISAYTGAISITANNTGNGRTLDIKNESGALRVVNAKSITASAKDTYTVQIFGDNTVNSALDISLLKVRSGTSEFTRGGALKQLLVDSGATAKISATGALTISGALTLDGSLENAGVLTLGGTATLKSSIVNSGTLTLNEGLTLDLSHLTFTEQDGTHSLTLFTGGGTVNGFDTTKINLVLANGTVGKAFSYSDGVLSYVMTVSELFYAGGELDWRVGASLTNAEGVATPFAADDIVTFSGDTVATLTEAVSSAEVTLNEGSTLSLTNGGVAENTLSTQRLVVNGELVLKDAALASDTRVLAGNTGSVVIDAAPATNLEFASQLADFTGALIVQGGRYSIDTEKTTPFASISVTEGGQLNLNSNYAGAITIEGNGIGEEAFRDTAMRLGSNTISGKVTVAGSGASLAVYSGYTGVISGELAGTGTFTKTEDGQLNLDGNITHTGKLDIKAGTVRIGDSKISTKPIGFSSIDVASGAKLHLWHGAADTMCSINLNGGTIYAEDLSAYAAGNEPAIVRFQKLMLTADSTIQYRWKGSLAFSSLEGTGNIAFRKGESNPEADHRIAFDKILNYSGTLSRVDNDLNMNVTVSAVHQDDGFGAVVKEVGTINVNNFVKTGTGNLALVGDVAASGFLTMNYEGGLFSDEAMSAAGLNITSVADNTYLTYQTTGTALSLNYSVIADTVLGIDLTALRDSIPADGFDLGITGATAADVTSLENRLNVLCIAPENWTLALGANGNVFLKLAEGAGFETLWDFSWGADVLASQPRSTTSLEAPSNYTYLGTDYLVDGVVAVTLTGTAADAASVSIVGGAGSPLNTEKTDAETNQGSSFTGDTWIEVQGGNYSLIVGGNYANNWNGGSAAHFNGDSHIAMKGGSVQYILGGNYKDGAAAWFNGDTYISIFEGAEVKGSIIGSGVSTHSVGSKMNGNSHIYIYTPLSSNEGAVALHGSTPNAVIGSSLHATNQGVTMQNTGSTNITVDLSKYSGTAEFVKMLVGGDFLAVGKTDTSVIEGSTNIAVNAGAAVTFTSNIIGGTLLTSCANNSSVTIKGDTSIDLNGGTIGNGTDTLLVVGGMLTTRDYTRTGFNLNVGGSSNILVDGATLNTNTNIIAGSFVADKVNSATIAQGGSNVQLTSGTVGGYVTGGHYIDGASSATFGTASVGDVSLAVQGAAVSGDIYGGSYNNRKAAAAQLTQGDITVDLKSGTVRNVYAAGYQNGTATMTTDSTTVKLSSGITLAEGAIISGGYKMGEGAANATVTGSSTLVFADTSYSNLSNVTFKDFNTVSVAANGIIDVDIEVAPGAALTKTGAGTLKYGGAAAADTLTVQEGTLSLKASTTLTATTVLGGATLDASAATGSNGGALTLGGAAGDVVNLNLGSGLAVSSLALTEGTKMNVLGAGSLGSDYTLTLFTGLTSGSITGITFGGEEGLTAALDAYVSNAADFSGAELVLTTDGSLVITTQGAGGSWKWNAATTDGIWSASSVEDWSNASGTTPDGNSLVFGDEGLAASGATTIVISGPVAPTQVTVNANSGEYIFTGDGNDATADGIGGAASLVKEGTGKLTISLANTYSGGTTISAGTLEATVTGALGSGDVALNGGTLSVSADLNNKIIFGGGTLNYLEDTTVSLDKMGRTDTGSVLVSVAEGKTVTWTAGSVAAFGNGMTLSGTGTLKITDGYQSKYGTTESSFSIAEGAILHFVSSNPNADIMSKLVGTGKVLLEGNGGAVSLQGDNTGFAGTLELTSANDTSSTPFYFHTATAGGGAQTTLLLNNAIFRSAGNTIAAGTVQLQGVNYLNDTYYYGAAQTTTLSGALTGDGTLKVSKGSTLNLAGNLTGFTGTLSEGTDGSGSIYVDFGARNGEAAAAYATTGNIFGTGVNLTTSAEGAAAEYRFNYSSDTLNMNATVGGAAALTQNGTGKLVLTEDNGSTGTLTVNSGTVAIGAAGDSAAWAGSYDVNGTGVLDIVNVTGGTVTGNIVADESATVKVTGATAAGETVTLASLQGGMLETSGSLTIASNATVAQLTNTGTIRLESTADDGTVTRCGLTIQGGTTAGGDIVADQIVLGGDSTFGSLDVANGLISSDDSISRNLTLNGDSTISGTFGPVKTLTTNATLTLKTDNMYLRGDLNGTGSVVVEKGQLTLESGTANLDGSASASGNVNLNGTGAHRFGGDLKVGGTLNLAGTLNVVGTLYGLNTIALNTSPVPGFSAGADREITVGTLNVASDLTILLKDDAAIESLGLRNGSSYTLLAASALQVGGQAISDTNQLLLKLGVSGAAGTLANSYALGTNLYTLEVDGNNIVLVARVAGNEWKDDVEAPSGEWTGSAYVGSAVPSEQETAAFLGSGPATVQVSADGVEVGKVVVDTTLAGTQQYYDQESYTFTGGELTTGGLTVSAGELVIANNVSVETSGADANRGSWTGVVAVGDASSPDVKAVLTVEEGATLSADSLTVNSQDGFINKGTTAIAGTAQVTSISNEGTMSVAGALAAGSVSNSGTLSAGDSSNIGMLTGTGAVTVGESSTIGTVAGAQSLTVGAGADISAVTGVATVTVGAKATLGDVVGTAAATDTVRVGGGSTVTSVSAVESLTVGGDSTVTTVEGVNTLVADGTGTVAVGTVNTGLAELAANGANLEIATLGTTAGEVSGSIGKVTAADGSEVKLTGTGAVEIGALSGSGTFSAAGVDVKLTGTPTGLMNVTAKSLDLTAVSGSSFGVVTAEAYTLDVAAFAADTVPNALMTATSLGNSDITLTLTSVETLVETAAKALAVDGVDSVDYTLISQLNPLNAASLNVELTDAARIHQLFALAGKYNAGLVPDANATALYATAVTVGKDVVLRVSTEAERVWNTADNFAGELDFNGVDNWYTRLAYVDKVNVNQTTTIDLTNLNGVDSTYDATTAPAGLNVQNLTGNSALTIKGSADDLATLNNKENTALSNTLTIEGDGFNANVTAENGATLSVNELALAGGASLNVDDTATFFVGKLTAADATAGTLKGTVNVTGEGGRYMGSWDNATVNMAAAGASQTLAPAAGLTVTGTQGTAILDYTAGNATMGAINTTGASVKLDNIGAEGQMNVLTLVSASSMQGGELAFGVKAADIAQSVNNGTAAPVITNGAALDLSGTRLNVALADANVQRTTFDVSQGTEELTLFTVSADGAMDGVTVSFGANDQFFSRYFTNVEVKNGKVVADLVTDYYAGEMSTTANGTVGLRMMDATFLALNPQGASDAEGANPQYADLAGVLNSLDEYRKGNGALDAEADKLGAAVAGSGVASVGMALSGDMERQLKAIRNRTTTMGVDPNVINEDMPYFNAWINAEGDHRSLDEDSTYAGYTLTSWGGTVGFDMDVNDMFTWGLAVTAMYGDFSSESADAVEGDMDTYYVSAFARGMSGAWVHTFVASVGLSTSELSRTVSHNNGSYTAEGEADGMSFGLLYEVARTYALNEDATACWQPVFNVAYRHIEVDAYSETGSDAALSIGEQSLDTLTFGLGARVQAIVGENIYNRTSVFEARALVKFDAGDRESEMETALFNLPSARGTVKSAEVDAFGVELGAGLTVPVGFDAGAIFLDGSVEFRGSYTNANATFGYRVNF